jgi:hypothetical protein
LRDGYSLVSILLVPVQILYRQERRERKERKKRKKEREREREREREKEREGRREVGRIKIVNTDGW